jgi:phosphoenolpyruvate carboxykinase (GTP)
MAMLPFCGYDMADYFAHWLEVGRRDGARLPRIFYVNWFRKDADGKFLWPGFGENARVLAWIFRRCDEAAGAARTAIGDVPRPGDLPLEGLDIAPERVAEVLAVDAGEVRGELEQTRAHLERFGDRLPPELWGQFEALEQRLA